MLKKLILWQDQHYTEKDKIERRIQDIAAALLGMCIAFIMWLTVLSREIRADNVIMIPFHSFYSILENVRASGIKSNIIGNIAMFIPLGILFPLTTERVSGLKMNIPHRIDHQHRSD